jgi:hypothetical protein
MFDILTKVVNNVVDEAVEFVEHPVDKTIDTLTQPLRDSVAIVHGLTEGELRVKAIARLGADVAGGMAAAELIDWYLETADLRN